MMPPPPLMSSSDPAYMTPAQLALRWHLARQTLANWRAQGKGPPFIRVSGGRILYPIHSIYSFEANKSCSTEL